MFVFVFVFVFVLVSHVSHSAGVTGVLPTEIFNQTARPAAYTIAGSLMWLNLFIVGMLFPFIVVRAVRVCLQVGWGGHVKAWMTNNFLLLNSDQTGVMLVGP